MTVLKQNLALFNLRLVCSGGIVENRIIFIRQSLIVEVSEYSVEVHASKSSDFHFLDMQGWFAAPGLIDLQVYGSGGKLLGSNPDVTTLHQMENDFIKTGTTGFYATIASNSAAVVEASLLAANELLKCEINTDQGTIFNADNNDSLTSTQPPSMRIGNFWGIHMEGPYINSVRRGAHPLEFIQNNPSRDNIQDILNLSQGSLVMMTIAPEVVSSEVRELLHKNGIVLSAGHTNASYKEAKEFFCSSGRGLIRASTHLFNAMPVMHHRDPGIVPVIFEEKPFTSIIVDGVHVDYTMVKLAKKHLQHKLFLITDAVTESTTGTYQHKFKSSPNRFVMPDGTLSGSALSMLSAVANCVRYCEISLSEAVNMASLYPAQLVGYDRVKGQISVGYDADLCFFDDDFKCTATFLGGKLVYSTFAVNVI